MAETARVLIVDDSRSYRAAIEEALRNQDQVQVVGSVFSGRKALEFLQTQPADLVTLDVEMPEMDGLQTLEAIQEVNRLRCPASRIGVVMVSAYTERGADITIKALQAGAFDFVTKPSSATPETSLALLRADLVPKIRLFLARRKRLAEAPAGRAESGAPAPVPRLARPRTLRAVLIGASTGGPKALATVIPDLVARIDAPLLIAQHMPEGFTRSLAANLSQATRCRVLEAEAGQRLESRTAYIAPGGRHLELGTDGTRQLIANLTNQPPVEGCRPSATVLFRSAAQAVGCESVAVILSGMGSDGTEGLAALKRAGGLIVAQDEATSVVWGMPGSAVAAGLTDVVVPLADIGATVERLAAG
jgi:two-component system chemotaxis response regulator CheB